MRSGTEALKKRLLAFPPDDKAVLAQEVWDSIEHFVDREVEKAWLDEAEKRWQQIEEGKAEIISAEEALARARKLIAR